MRNNLFIVGALFLFHLAPAGAVDSDSFSYDFELSLERSALDGLSLGDDSTEDRLVEEDYELEFDLEYQFNDDFYLFFVGAFVDETETIETADIEDEVSGLERKEIGVGYLFGDEITSELRVGRTEFVSASEWWLWWDEELDSIRLDSGYGNFDATLALAEEQARENTDDDFIDPELDGVKRVILSLGWEFADNQSLILYYLDQTDDSESFNVGEFENFDEIDEEDADLTWSGISYLGEFKFDAAGEFGIELHYARVSGDETLYEFGDPAGGRSEVEERDENSVSGSAQSFLLGWSPPVLDDWTFILGHARGDGDSNPDNNRDKSYRQNGLQGDSESFGELYQPELSNLAIDVIGVRWKINDGVELALLSYDYEQRERADEMRDVSIENDTEGSSRDLGREVDLVLTIETADGLELVLTAAEFHAGSAYAGFSDETSSYFDIELIYAF